MGWLGAVMPYFALELQGRGVVGWTFAAAVVAIPVARLSIGPLWGLLADRIQDETRVLRVSIVRHVLVVVVRRPHRRSATCHIRKVRVGIHIYIYRMRVHRIYR